MTDDEDALEESQVRAALERAATALEQVYETIADLDAGKLSVSVWQTASARVGVLLSEFDKASGEVNRLLGLSSAQGRLLTYLRSRLGQQVRMEELRGVAAIYEWARRIRELRVEQGWPISSRIQRPDIAPGMYVLEADEPNAQVAEDWRTASFARKLPGSGKNRGLEYLRLISPRSADSDQLAYVMKIKSYARRLRELDEEGWRIVSNVDDPTLAPGSYRLESEDRRPPRARQAIKLRYQILERDKYRCRDCGRSPDEDGVTLQIHHLLFVSQGGDNSEDNLITLCSDCHAGRHAIAGGKAKDELLDPGWWEGLDSSP